MVYKVNFDNTNKVINAEIWIELKIPPSELDALPNGFKFGDFAWVDAESEEDALTKAQYLVQ